MSAGGREFGADVEVVVRRALAPHREDRWPDVQTYVEALSTALAIELGPTVDGNHGPLPEPWMPLDPNLTQPGPRPSAVDVDAALPDPTPPVLTPAQRVRRIALITVGALVALGVGAGVGYSLQGRQNGVVALADSTGSLTVSVPRTWTASVATGQWTPPEQEGELPALSAGTADDWATAEDGEGVFVGVMASEDMPEELPGHAECESVLDPVSDVDGDDPVLTQVSTGCPGVIVERVRQVALGRYLWVQVRSLDRAAAYGVLDDVAAPGF